MYCKLQNVVIFLKKNFTHRKKCPYLEFFWPVFSRTLTEYRNILRISPYSVRMRENMDRKGSKYGLCSGSISFNFSKAKTKFYLNFDYNGKNSYLFVNGKKSYKFKADNINLYFLTLVVLRIISEKYDSDYATQTSDYWY